VTAPPRRPARLFIVGAPRCGTTAMFRFLEQHPRVCASSRKEPNYFSTDFHEESDRHFGAPLRFPFRTEAQYLALFDDPSRSVMLEGSTTSLQSRVAAANIRAFDPDARILVMVRDPVDLLHSLHAKMVSNALEDIADFRLALEAEPDRRAGRRLPAGLFWPSSLYYSDRVRLAEGIERFRAHFPADRVKVVVYDDFRRDNLAAYLDVAAFAGLDLAFRPETHRVNPNQGARSPALSRALARLGDSAVVRLAVPRRVRLELGRFVRRYAKKPLARVPLDPDLRRTLMARFRPEVEALSRTLDRDLLALWGYNQLP
jgi:hypothetical protein